MAWWSSFSKMKRLMVNAVLMALAGVALAQSSFTIRRPLEGATVRETVDIRIPVKSIPGGQGFVGIWVNGRFLEAVSPYYPAVGVNTTATDFIYKLDTKAFKIPDGQMTIEAVLYANRGSFTQPINKSSVVVRLDNSASIRIPSNGLLLRYPFTVNSEYVYRVEYKNTLQSLTDAQAQLGSRAGEVESQPETFRYRMTVMNRYKKSDGTTEGLLLMQPITERGRDYAMLTTAGNTAPQKYYDYMMEPLYMRLANNGREIYGAWPIYAPNGASFGEASTTDLIAMLPLPILPSRGVRPGGPAFSGFLPQATLDLAKSYETESFTKLVQARGTLEGIEYERGRPCAKIRNVLAQGDPATGVLEFDEYYWFALDLGMPIKIERRYTVTTRVRENVGGGGGATGGGGGGRTPGRGPGGRGQDTSGQEGEGRAIMPGLPMMDEQGNMSLIGPGLIFDSSYLRQQAGSGARGGSLDGGPPSGGGNQAGGPPSGGGGGGGRTRTRLVRQRTVITMTME